MFRFLMFKHITFDPSFMTFGGTLTSTTATLMFSWLLMMNRGLCPTGLVLFVYAAFLIAS